MAARSPTPIGEKFSRLTVLGDAPYREGNKNRRVHARCDCGTIRDYVLSEVRLGKTQSCGCLQRSGEPYKRHGHVTKRRFSPEYYSWASMMTRCTNSNHPKYSDYGGRGIRVCERWHTFENFLEDMGPRPDGMTLERVLVNEGYEPENCVWATRKRQSNNTRSNTFLEHAGKRQTVAEWSDETGLAYNTIIARIHRLGWSAERALTTPPRRSYER